MALGRMARPTAVPAGGAAGGGPAPMAEQTMPGGMPTKPDKGRAMFGTGQGIGGEATNKGQDNRGRQKQNLEAFANIPQLDTST